jgi:hypothetical protein
MSEMQWSKATFFGFISEHVEDIHTSYEDDLPDSIGFIAEMERLKMFCAGLQKQDYNHIHMHLLKTVSDL